MLSNLLETLGIQPVVVAVQAGLFLVLLVAMRYLFFGPLTRVLARRREELDAAAKEIAAARKEAEELAARHEKQMKEVERQAYERVQQAVRDAQAERAEILRKAHEEAEEAVRKARAEIRAERDAALKSLESGIASLSLSAAERATGEPYPAGEFADPARRIVSELENRA